MYFLLILPFLFVISFFVILKLYLFFTIGYYEPSNVDLSGKTAVITGASSGIGKETAKTLATLGARVYMACRNVEKAESIAVNIRKLTKNSQVFVLKLDLSQLSSVRTFAEKFIATESRLDILINNAGIDGTGRRGKRTEDGLNLVMASNHFGHFLLTNLLIDKLRISSPSRVIIVSSQIHYHAKDFYQGNFDMQLKVPTSVAHYCNSKLANILFAKELSRRLFNTGITVNSCTPGLVRTSIFQNVSDNSGIWWKIAIKVLLLFSRAAHQGSMAVTYLAVSKEVEHISGEYFADNKPSASLLKTYDRELAIQLWEESGKLTGLTKSTMQNNNYITIT